MPKGDVEDLYRVSGSDLAVSTSSTFSSSSNSFCEPLAAQANLRATTAVQQKLCACSDRCLLVLLLLSVRSGLSRHLRLSAWAWRVRTQHCARHSTA
jgi:hypothetical protein